MDFVIANAYNKTGDLTKCCWPKEMQKVKIIDQASFPSSYFHTT